MGLDMYLERDEWVGDEERKKYNLPNNVKYLRHEVGYWRKANAIHKWFVDNVQKGQDDCKKYYVTKNDLQPLLEKINKILGCNEEIVRIEIAKQELPTCEGFFFGSTEYDPEYFDDLNYTKKLIEGLKDDEDYEYQSSW